MSKEDFYDLTPDEVMHALETTGLSPTGRFTQLNSYENRVFDIHLEPGSPEFPRIIVKFYRPGRWSERSILDEHELIADLTQAGLPVIAPKPIYNGRTVMLSRQNIWFAVFPRAMARMVDEFHKSDFSRLGQTLARMHNVGSTRSAPHRPTLNAEVFGDESLKYLQGWIHPEIKSRYNEAAQHILDKLRNPLTDAKKYRIHGDCHRGNILKTDFKDRHSEFFFVDFDDCCMGPAVQDFWMLLSESENSPDGSRELQSLLDGYRDLRHFDDRELLLIPGLRALRIIHYSAWIAHRWEDPSFPNLFPQFLEYDHWLSDLRTLEELARQV